MLQVWNFKSTNFSVNRTVLQIKLMWLLQQAYGVKSINLSVDRKVGNRNFISPFLVLSYQIISLWCFLGSKEDTQRFVWDVFLCCNTMFLHPLFSAKLFTTVLSWCIFWKCWGCKAWQVKCNSVNSKTLWVGFDSFVQLTIRHRSSNK